jgi:hypothetical protein
LICVPIIYTWYAWQWYICVPMIYTWYACQWYILDMRDNDIYACQWYIYIYIIGIYIYHWHIYIRVRASDKYSMVTNLPHAACTHWRAPHFCVRQPTRLQRGFLPCVPLCCCQVLVYHDLLGMMSHPHHAKVTPKFCKSYAQVGLDIQVQCTLHITNTKLVVLKSSPLAGYL